MPTSYIAEKKPSLTFGQLKKKLKEANAIEKYGLEYCSSKENGKHLFCITDGNSFVWAFDAKGRANRIGFIRYTKQSTVHMVSKPLGKLLGTPFISEHSFGYQDIIENEYL